MVAPQTIVTIVFGPLAGLKGVVVSDEPTRSTVRIAVGGLEVLVELDPDMIEPAKPALFVRSKHQQA